MPVSLSAFDARLEDRVQVVAAWTPPEHRNKGFDRILLAYTLDLKKKNPKGGIVYAYSRGHQRVSFSRLQTNWRLSLSIAE